MEEGNNILEESKTSIVSGIKKFDSRESTDSHSILSPQIGHFQPPSENLVVVVVEGEVEGKEGDEEEGEEDEEEEEEDEEDDEGEEEEEEREETNNF